MKHLPPTSAQWTRAVVLLGPLLAASSLTGQRSPGAPELVLDLDPGHRTTSVSSNFSAWINGRALIAYAGGGPSNGLYSTDGTAAGTRKIVEIGPTGLSGIPEKFVRFGSRHAFVINRELWVSDGTRAGTRSVFQSQTTRPFRLTALGQKLLFCAESTAVGIEPMVTDGTPRGTGLLRDVWPGTAASVVPRSPETDRMAVYGGRAYFSANDGVHGHELWSTDGTPAGTRLVVDAIPGSASVLPRYLVASAGGLYFFSAGTAPALWKSDGSAAGTQLVRRFAHCLALEPTATGVALHTVQELWQSDGTPGTTVRVAALPRAVRRVAMRAVGDSIYCASGEIDRHSLRHFSRRTGSIRILAEVSSLQPSAPVISANSNGVLAVIAGTSLWAATPQAATRLQVGARIRLQAASTNSETLFLRDGDWWVTSGTPSSTRRFREAASVPLSGYPTGFADLDGTTLFVARKGNRTDAWRTDGTRAGTYRLGAKGGGQPIDSRPNLVRCGQHVYGTTGRSGALWRSRGGRNDVEVVFDASPVNGRLLTYRSTIFFVTGTNSSAIWAVDDRAARPVKLLSRPNPIEAMTSLRGELCWVEMNSANADWMRANGGRPVLMASVPFLPFTPIWLAANHKHAYAVLGPELHVTDGTATGTHRLRRESRVMAPGIVTDDHLFFAGTDAAEGREPWVSDGTPNGTRLLRALVPGPGSSAPSRFARLANQAVFGSTGDFAGLWISDGTFGGTRPLIPLRSGGPVTLRSPVHAIGGRHVWCHVTTTAGAAFVRTDGTLTGTRVVPGMQSARPLAFVHANGMALVGFDDSKVGTELFKVWPGATAQPTGLPCAGKNRWPTLSASDPVLGQTMTVRARELPTQGRPAALFLLPPITQASPLLGTRCVAHGDWTRFTLLASRTSNRPDWDIQLPLPNLTALDRAQAILRVVVAPTDGPLFGDLTNAVRLAFGD